MKAAKRCDQSAPIPRGKESLVEPVGEVILDRPAHGHLTAEGTEKQATHHMIMSRILVGRKILTNRLQSGAMVYNHPPAWPGMASFLSQGWRSRFPFAGKTCRYH